MTLAEIKAKHDGGAFFFEAGDMVNSTHSLSGQFTPPVEQQRQFIAASMQQEEHVKQTKIMESAMKKMQGKPNLWEKIMKRAGAIKK
jgi:hypothetical protein